MTELTWLADLIVNHELNPKTKKHVLKRMKQVEININTQMPQVSVPIKIPAPAMIHGVPQAPSTIAAMQRHGIEPPQAPIVASAQAAQALQTRQQMIDQAMSGKVEKGHTSPPKAHATLK